MQYELRRGMIVDVGYVGSRGVGLLGKINLRRPGRSARDAGQRLHRHLRPARTRHQPGLLRAAGVPRPEPQRRVPAAHQHRPLDVSQPADEGARAASAGRSRPTSPTRLSRSMDTLSSDGGLVEHDPDAAGEQLRAVRLRPHASADDELHRSMCPAPGATARSPRALTGDWNLSGIVTYQSGTPFSVHRQPDAERLLRAGRPRRASASRRA